MFQEAVVWKNIYVNGSTAFWDKTSPINEFTAERFLELSPWIKEGMDILLVSDEIRVNQVDSAEVVRDILGLPEASLEELAAAWQEKLNTPIPEPEPNPSAEERIAALESEIAQLKSALNGGV